MNTKDYFKDIYTDFFGIESLPKLENETNNDSKKGSQETMASLFNKICDLNISDDSKTLLKKIIEYMRKYNEHIETNYIPFKVILECNLFTKDEVVNILFEAAKYFNYIDKTDLLQLSLYDLKNETNFNSYGMIVLHSLNGLSLEEEKVVQKFLYNLKNFLNQNTHVVTIISGTKNELTNFFLGKEDLKNNYFDLSIIEENPDVQDIYNEIINKTNLDDETKIKLLDYLTSTYNKELDFVKYKEDLIKYISFNKEVPQLRKQKSEEEIFANLNELVGLQKVKKVFYELVDVIKLKEKAGDDIHIKDINLHMVFLGNPGTGKTTIARLIADILYNLNYIKENKFIEVSAKDLVAEYVGQTAPKTMAVIEKSLNGVLFIDEAYILASKDGNSYNDEAIATLIQAMENYRDKLVVIFAGYTKEMQAFLNSNSGITSRIGYTLEFDDYTTDELIEIFLGMVNKAGFIVEDDAINYLREIIEKYRTMDNFGNARFIRNIYEKTVVKHAANVKNKKQKKILKTITKNDISIENLILK